MTSNLRRLQWAVRGVLTLGVAASVIANVLHAQPNPIAQAIAAWPPLALLLTVELVSRIPIYRPLLGVVRILATAIIAGIAAWISYWHMNGVVARYGEVGSVPYLLPLSVDGLIIVASASLVELAGRARQGAQTPVSPATPAAEVAPHPEPVTPTENPHNADEALPVDPPGTSHQKHGVDPDRNSAEVGTDAPEPPRSPRRNEHTYNEVRLAADLVPLLPAARAARDELVNDGATVSRDALAARLRRNGTPIRNTRASKILAALKAETAVNEHDLKAHV